MVTNISSRRLDDDATSTTHLTARLAVLDHRVTIGLSGGSTLLPEGERGTGPSKSWLGPRNLAVLLAHCGQLILRKSVNLMPPDVRF